MSRESVGLPKLLLSTEARHLNPIGRPPRIRPTRSPTGRFGAPGMRAAYRRLGPG